MERTLRYLEVYERWMINNFPVKDVMEIKDTNHMALAYSSVHNTESAKGASSETIEPSNTSGDSRNTSEVAPEKEDGVLYSSERRHGPTNLKEQGELKLHDMVTFLLY
ncbi:hypothetical protein Bca4012_010849 [Brassica carinata]